MRSLPSFILNKSREFDPHRTARGRRGYKPETQAARGVPASIRENQLDLLIAGRGWSLACGSESDIRRRGSVEKGLKPQWLRTKLVDFKGVAKLPPFSGDDADWFEWKFRFTSVMGLLRVAGEMKFCAAMHEPVPFARLGPQAKQKSALLYNLLIALVKGRALAILRRVADSNGLEVWRQLVLEYEPQQAARYSQMLHRACSTPHGHHRWRSSWICGSGKNPSAGMRRPRVCRSRTRSRVR